MADNCYSDTTDNTWEDTTDNTWEKCVVIPGGHVPRSEVLKELISLKDYGRKPYLTTYDEMMKRPTISAIQNELKERYGQFEPKSEFEKPYLSDSYEEMQHYYPPPIPHLSNPEMWFPEFSGPIPDTIEEGIGWYITGCSLKCDTSIIRKCEKEYCCTLNPAFQPVESIDITGPAELTRQGKKAKKTGDEICFILTADAKDGDKVTITVKTKPRSGQKKGGSCSDSFSVNCDKCDCAVENAVAYSDAGSDDTIDRNGVAVITVTDGCPPYSWVVTGTGFGFTKAATAVKTNTLTADNTACGTATITVTDKCGDTCTGYVRCTTGQWASCASFAQGGCCDLGCNEHTVYKEKYKYVMQCGNRSGYGVTSWTGTCNGVGFTLQATDVCQSGWKFCEGEAYEWTC